ncbi:MAG: MoaD/ThiS family protein [Chloroflexota bacterium]|nr:MoaD/ThiS family protein [Dehalococcoidia bacterium]MDW8254981.1 MoaD/ThiS family protein [Chloroflexota bacterium]
MITVVMYLDLPQLSRSGKKEQQIPFEPGMRARDILDREFPASDHDLIMIAINGEHSPPETPLRDGDKVELLHPMVGGALTCS